MKLEDAQKRSDATPEEERLAMAMLTAFKEWAAAPNDLGVYKTDTIVAGVTESISGRHLVCIDGYFDLVEIARIMLAKEK